jgi:hypothetical protein
MDEVAAMLYEFLQANRAELITRCRVKAAKRTSTVPVSEHGVPQFLGQLIETFRVEQTPEALARRRAAGPGRPSLSLVPPDIPSTAAKHGDELRRQGLTIDQVVHDYGDLCQALTELAMERNAPITVDEFHTFNRCLDDAIADAVTSYSRDGLPATSKAPVPASTQWTGSPAEQMRNSIETAIQAFAAIKGGQVGLQGTTSAMHERSLLGLRDLVDRVLADPRMNVEAPAVKKGS